MITRVKLLQTEAKPGGDKWRITFDCGHTIVSVRFGGAPMRGDAADCPYCHRKGD